MSRWFGSSYGLPATVAVVGVFSASPMFVPARHIPPNRRRSGDAARTTRNKTQKYRLPSRQTIQCNAYTTARVHLASHTSSNTVLWSLRAPASLKLDVGAPTLRVFPIPIRGIPHSFAKPRLPALFQCHFAVILHSVYLRGVHRCAQGAWRAHLYGRQGPLARQCVRGAPLAQPQAGRGLPARVRDGERGQEGELPTTCATLTKSGLTRDLTTERPMTYSTNENRCPERHNPTRQYT